MTKFIATLAMLAAVVALLAGRVPGEGATQENKPMLRAVIHVNFGDAERHGHGLKNLRNILAAEGQAEIEVVAHGAGIALVVQGQSQHAEAVAELVGRGVRFVACKNTLRDKSIAEDRLLPGVGLVPSGAVEVVRKQQEGFGYFRP